MFPLRFNIGGARTDASTACAKLGKNIINWSNGGNVLSTTATFDNSGPGNGLTFVISIKRTRNRSEICLLGASIYTRAS